jgi:hypothetical protein
LLLFQVKLYKKETKKSGEEIGGRTKLINLRHGGYSILKQINKCMHKKNIIRRAALCPECNVLFSPVHYCI